MDYLEHDGGAGSVAATLAATEASALPRIEIVEERRRSHDAAFRAHVVADALAPGARVEELGRRYGICTSLIYRWRRAVQGPAVSAPTVKLVPVRVAEPSKVPTRPSSASSRPALESKRPGPIEIELEGGIRISVEADVSLAALRRVMAALRG